VLETPFKTRQEEERGNHACLKTPVLLLSWPITKRLLMLVALRRPPRAADEALKAAIAAVSGRMSKPGTAPWRFSTIRRSGVAGQEVAATGGASADATWWGPRTNGAALGAHRPLSGLGMTPGNHQRHQGAELQAPVGRIGPPDLQRLRGRAPAPRGAQATYCAVHVNIRALG